MTSTAVKKKMTTSASYADNIGSGVNDALKSIRQTIQGNLQTKKESTPQKGSTQSEPLQKDRAQQEVISSDVLHLTQELQARKVAGAVAPQDLKQEKSSMVENKNQ